MNRMTRSWDDMKGNTGARLVLQLCFFVLLPLALALCIQAVLIKTASTIVGSELIHLTAVDNDISKKTGNIISDKPHTAYHLFELLYLGKHFRSITTNKSL